MRRIWPLLLALFAAIVCGRVIPPQDLLVGGGSHGCTKYEFGWFCCATSAISHPATRRISETDTSCTPYAVDPTIGSFCWNHSAFDQRQRRTFSTSDLQCDPYLTGYNVGVPSCPAGQYCHPFGICQPFKRAAFNHNDSGEDCKYNEEAVLRGLGASERCGKEHEVKTCEKSQYGPCCSRLGWCGRTELHCLPKYDCQNGCTNDTTDIGHSSQSRRTLASTIEPTVTFVRKGAMQQDAEHTFSQEKLIERRSAAPGPRPAPDHPNPGIFTIAGSSGAAAMHAALLQNGKVVFLDKVENFTEVKLIDGRPVYSTEYDPATQNILPLAYDTNAFCCGGSFLPNGTLISVGGNGPLPEIDPLVADGFDAIRYLKRSASNNDLDGASWSEPGNKLASKRWYASSQIMSNGSTFVCSGSINGLDIGQNENNNPTFEILDQDGRSRGQNIPMDILVRNQPYLLYPFLHFLRDGTMFVFTAKQSQIFDVANNQVVKELPNLAGLYRTYPNTGSSVMLPLSSKDNYKADILICGGGAYADLSSPTDPSCGRIRPEIDDSQWEMDAMPEGRCMVEGTLLPDGTVLWLNGAGTGSQGFGIADLPTLDALIYDPRKLLGNRWFVAGRSEIPRLYHSVALLLLDGTVLVAGSNPNEQPVLLEDTDESVVSRKYPTEYRVEIYTPPYLIGDNANRRPENMLLSTKKMESDGRDGPLTVSFTLPEGGKELKVFLYHGGFVTHALHMGQRMVELDCEDWVEGAREQSLKVNMPGANWASNVLPPGPYVLYVVVDGVPGVGQYVEVS